MRNYLSLGRGLLGLAAVLGCGHALAQRERWQNPETRGRAAFEDIQRIMEDTCDYGKLPGAQTGNHVSRDGFQCNEARYQWDEIFSVECTGRAVVIQGRYDTSRISALGPVWKDDLPQCLDLADAMNIYLQERKK